MIGQAGPEYQQAADAIRSKITAGERGFEIGGKLTIRQIQKITGTTYATARDATNHLKTEGILEGRQGKGVYVKAMPADLASERLDIKTLSEQVAELQRQVGDLTERAPRTEPGDFAEGLAELRNTVGRIEANLIDLYGKTGHAYPQGGSHDDAKAAAGRGRTRR